MSFIYLFLHFRVHFMDLVFSTFAVSIRVFLRCAKRNLGMHFLVLQLQN